MFCPPKDFQPFDPNNDPFIIGGRKLIDSMRIQVASLGKVMNDDVHKAACYDLTYLFFNPDLISDIYCEFLTESFSDKMDFYPPIETQRNGQKFIAVSFLENWQYCDEKPKMRIWGREESLQKKAQVIAYLHKRLEMFYLDRFTF